MEPMEIDEPRSPVNEVFGYRRIKWRISNYFAGRFCKDEIRSPVFCVYSPFLTKWEIGIRPRSVRQDLAEIYLKRVEYGVHRRFVRANFKFIFTYDENREKKLEQDFPFETPETIGLMKVVRFGECELNILNESLDFTVTCHIIVYGNDDSNVLEYYGGGCLKLLSQDLALLGYYKKETDTKLDYGSTKTINVHRAVLCCRNHVFNDIINDCSVADLDFPCEYIKGVEKLILFLYSGNLKYVLRVPSFAIEKAIEYFEVEELREYFTYDELLIETKYVVDEAEFLWTVRDVDKITKGCIVSHRMRGLRNEIFRLVLYPRGISGKEDYMCIKIQLIQGEHPRIFCVYFGVYDFIHNLIRNTQCCQWPPYDPTLDDVIIAGRDTLYNLFFNTRGEIRIFCKFQKYKNEVLVPVEEQYPVINKINNVKHYEKLSRDMTSLYTRGGNGDFWVYTRSSNITHIVHKQILCSRSYRFSLLVRNKEKINMKNVDPEVIDITFHYMYTGVLKENDPETVFKVFRFASRLGIQGLKNVCARIVEANLNVENALRTLVAAHQCKERSLKSAALSLIRIKYNEVCHQEYWHRFSESFPRLYYQIIHFLSLADNDEIEFEEFEIEKFLGKLNLAF